MAINKTAVIILSSDRLEGQFSSAAHSLAREWSKTRKVYFINRPFTIKDLIRKKGNPPKSYWKLILGFVLVKDYSPMIKSAFTGATLPINWLPPGLMYNVFQGVNNWIVRKSIQKVAMLYSIDSYVFINSYNPFYQPNSKRKLKNSVLEIYQSRDDISQDEYTSKHGVLLESIASSKAKLVITSSNKLKQKLSAYNLRTQWIPNGVDYELFCSSLKFDRSEVRNKMALTNFVIGYVGNLDDLRIDYSLIKEIVEQLPQITLLLVGPINSEVFFELGLDRYSNIQNTGAKKITELPEYLSAIDLAIIPFQTNKFTESIYPLKINEYLAAGKQVISTNFSEDIQLFKEVIEIATNPEDFKNKVSAILNNGSDKNIEVKQSVAFKNSWEERVKQLDVLFDEYYEV